VSQAGSGRRQILIVCHANTSRSVIAEAVLLRLLHEQGLSERVGVASGGIAPYARDGSLASLDARLVLREIGIDISPQTVAIDLKRHPEHFEAAHVILAMTDEQRRMLAAFPAADGKPVLLVRELVGESGDVDDPAMQDECVFQHCRDEIVRCLRDGLPALLERLEVRA